MNYLLFISGEFKSNFSFQTDCQFCDYVFLNWEVYDRVSL